MKSISSTLLTHLTQTTTTLATIWKLVRTDNVEFFFTDHDSDILFDGDTYKSSNSYNRSAIQNNASLSVDNMDIMGIFDDSEITEEDLRAGLFDYCEIFIAVVNWSDLSQGILKARRGHLGEVISTPQGYFRSEMRGMTQNLAQNIGEIYQAECRADLGDTRCKVQIRPALRADSTAYVVGQYIRVPTDLSVTTMIGLEPTQDAYENRIYRCTSAGVTGPTQPVYNTSVGASTTEEGIFATATLSFTGEPSDGQTAIIGSKTYTFQTTLTDVDGNVLIGATPYECAANLAAAINLDAGAGTLYALSMTANTLVEAELVSNTVVVTALVSGVVGNTIPASESLSFASFGATTTLLGGVDGATFVCEESYSRSAVIATIINTASFTLTISESRAVDDWFNGGGFIIETGENTGYAIEIRDWVQSTSTVTIFLPAPFVVSVGDKVRLYPGCDKRSEICYGKFNNILNFRGEPFIPGQDEVTTYPDAN